MMDATHSLTLILREGALIGSRKIATLVSFAVGNGSPGQGRGWLRTDGATPQVLALVILDDRSQALLSATYGNVAVTASQGGVTGPGGPDLPNATFASYGPPAANAVNDFAFAGSMTVNSGGVLRADAHAIFASNSSGTFTLVARVSKPIDQSNPTGAIFSVLKDPVLASDGALAFPATLRGGGLRGLAVNTLWHQPAGAPLELLAQGGAHPPGLPSAQFQGFTSLAIADTGPLYAATLVVGRGGVNASNLRGVWGADSQGVQRLLFRTGDVLNGKKVTAFAALTAVPGSLGTTHSFNPGGHVVWRATLSDRSTAIVKTAVP